MTESSHGDGAGRHPMVDTNDTKERGGKSPQAIGHEWTWQAIQSDE